jgi:transcriptional regulator with XRE-family HTH domain
MVGDLGETVRVARRALHLTQAQLAKRAGISASYLSRIESAAWERGGPWPADGVLGALARALGLSSTELIGLRTRARSTMAGESGQPEALARANGRPPYSVCIGTDEVDVAARRLVDRNPRHGTFRSVQASPHHHSTGDDPATSTYVDVLAERLAASSETLLYRVVVPARRHLDPEHSPVESWPGANVRSRVAFTNPLVMDVLIGDHEALIALPDRRGHPHLAACVVVDDPDFVDAMREWYDEWVWEPPGNAGAGRPGPAEAPAEDIGERLLS